MWIGIFLICLGALYLLRNLHIIYGNVWNWAWPLLLICIGLGILFKPGWHCITTHTDKKTDDSSLNT
jgi:hypothetical protein